jgi:hypothetical protein
MRTSVLATLLGLSLVACAGNITGGPGGDDDDIPATCGNGQLDEGEECDGEAGCSATCTMEAIPRVASSVDKTSISTELATSNMVTLTVTSEEGFTGPVSVTASIVDAADAPQTGWIVAVNPPSVTLTDGGSAPVVATIGIPSDSTLLTGKLKLTMTSSAGTSSITSDITALQQLTFNVNINNGLCVYPVDNTPINVKVGTVVRFMNVSTTNLVIHSNGNTTNGIPHQGPGTGQSPDDPVTEPNTAYTRTAAAAANFDWYCHQPATDLGGANPRLNLIP